MKWTEQTEDDLTIFQLEGDIDLNHSPQLRILFQSKIQAKAPALLLDFTAVNYIDSSGLATLVEYYQGSRPYNGKIALAAMSPRVKSVFELVRLNEIFPIFASVEEAKQSLLEQETV
jgi:anti-sigma B factor antagonist